MRVWVSRASVGREKRGQNGVLGGIGRRWGRPLCERGASERALQSSSLRGVVWCMNARCIVIVERDGNGNRIQCVCCLCGCVVAGLRAGVCIRLRDQEWWCPLDRLVVA